MRKALIAVGVVLAILGACFASREYYTSVCVKTGMTRYTRAYGPFKFHRTQATALSQVLVQSGYRDPTQHEWIYEHGRGWLFLRTRFTGSGNGLALRQSIESPQVASTVRLLIANTDKPTVEKWLKRFFDPENSSLMSYYLGDVEEHTNKQEFIRWLQEREDEITATQTNR
jgi:hypothetical protein